MDQDIGVYVSTTGNETAYTNPLLTGLYFLIENGKYHHALNAYHLLFMTFIYQTLLKARSWRPRKFNNSLIPFSHRELSRAVLLTSTSCFIFSKINERSIFDYLAIFDVRDSLIAKCKKLVDNRNERSHANGHYESDESLFSDKIGRYNELCFSIHSKTCSFLGKIFADFIADLSRNTELTDDDLELYLVTPNYLSSADLAFILSICSLQRKKHYKQVEQIINGY